MRRRLSGFLGIFIIVASLLASFIVPVLLWSNVQALSAPKIGFQQQTPYFDEANAMLSSAVSALGPGNVLYEIGMIEGTVDVDPGTGVDNRTAASNTAYVRVLTSAGGYVKTRILAGMEAGAYANVRSIVFNADKSSYYLVGQFYGDVDFDMTGGEAVHSPAGDGIYSGFIAKYQTSDDSLQAVQTLEGSGHSIVEDVAYSAIHDTVAISGRLNNGADPNPTAADETVTVADNTNAGFVSLYGAGLTYNRTMVYDIGAINSVTDVNDIAYNPDNGLLAAVVRMSGNSQTFNMQFDPVGEMGGQEVKLDNNRAASAIVFIDNGDYAGILPIALDTTIPKYDDAQLEVDYVEFDASGNLYYAGTAARASVEVPADFDFDVFTGSGDTRALPESWSHYVTKVTPGEGYNYDSTFFYPNPIPRGYLSEDDLTGVFIDPSGNLFLSGYWYVENNEGDDSYDVNPGGATDMRTVNDSTAFVIQVNSDMTFGYILTNGTNNSDAGKVWPNDIAVARDSSGNLFTISSIWYLSLIQDADTCEMSENWQSTIATVKFMPTGSDALGWLDFAPAPDTYVEGCDADNDGVSDADEGNIVGGDANGDETSDREQAYVSAMTNPITGGAVALEVDGVCTLSNVSVKSEAQTGNDANFTYPLGLLDFTASCGTNGFTSTIRQIYYDPPAGDFVLRKFANGAYQTITGAVITRTTLNGRNVLIVTYDVQDGGPLDADGEENGIIVDPAGLAISGADTPGVPDTGIETQANLPFLVSVSVGMVVLIFSFASIRCSRYAYKK